MNVDCGEIKTGCKEMEVECGEMKAGCKHL